MVAVFQVAVAILAAAAAVVAVVVLVVVVMLVVVHVILVPFKKEVISQVTITAVAVAVG